MLFRKKDSKQDISDIKEAMERPIEEMPSERRMQPMPPMHERPIERHVERHIEERRVERPIAPRHLEPLQPMHQIQNPYQSPEAQTSAPLFVKVDKYREILITLQEMKLFVSGVKQLFAVLHELDTLRTDAINIMRATVQRLEKSMTEVDQELLRPRGISLADSSAAGEVSHIEDTLTELQKQMAELRKELHGLR